MLRRGLAVALLALAAAPAAGAYPWPVKPFDRQHPIRGGFGDPRTVFDLSASEAAYSGPGSYSFHNGVDIVAPDRTPVYPVVSGTARVADGAEVDVHAARGRIFEYIHIRPLVLDGQRVVARRTVLGTILPRLGHVHLSEIDRDRVTNPLLPGHLTPYRDRTRPRVTAIEFRESNGADLAPLALCGRLELDAEAYDTPPLPVPGAWAGLPVAPVLVRWRIEKLDGEVVVPDKVAADFRKTLPPEADFAAVYARGTYQNAPRFGRQQFGSLPGRFLFLLSRGFDTRRLANGVYALTVTALDERGNAGVLTERFSVYNSADCDISPPPAA